MLVIQLTDGDGRPTALVGRHDDRHGYRGTDSVASARKFCTGGDAAAFAEAWALPDDHHAVVSVLPWALAEAERQARHDLANEAYLEAARNGREAMTISARRRSLTTRRPTGRRRPSPTSATAPPRTSGAWRRSTASRSRTSR